MIGILLFEVNKGAYIKYVGVGVGVWGQGGGFYRLFRKYFVAQGAIELNISRPSNFFEKKFMAPRINFSFFLRLESRIILGYYSQKY